MKRSVMSILAATALLDSFGQTAERAASAVRRFGKAKSRRNRGTKLQRKAEAGTLTMRAPGGVVSQLYREIQQRNRQQGAIK
jgi:hypothetical protein